MYIRIGDILRKSIELHLAECGHTVRRCSSSTVDGAEFYSRLLRDTVLFPPHEISMPVVGRCVEFLAMTSGASTEALRGKANDAAKRAYHAAYVPWSKRRGAEMHAWRAARTVEAVCEVADTLWGRRLGPAPWGAIPVFPDRVICQPIHWAANEWHDPPTQTLYEPGNREAAERLLRMRRHLYDAPESAAAA